MGARLGVATGKFRPRPAVIEELRVRRPYDLGPRHQTGRRIAVTACAERHGPDLTGGQAG